MRCNCALVLGATLSVAVSVPNAAGQTIIRVDANSTATSPDGTTWALAYPYLQDGLAAAASAAPSEVWVAAGTYRPDRSAASPGGTGSPTAKFTLLDDIAIYGGFSGAGTETSLSQRDVKGNVTILSGNLGGGNYAYHVVTGDHIGASARLDGFRITGGRATGSGFDA